MEPQAGVPRVQADGKPPVTLVATMLNEEASLPALLRSIEAQTRLPDEVVFADGGSRDGTLSLLRTWATSRSFPVRVLECPGTNIAAGRNRAISAAAHEVICCTDAGVVLEPEWLGALSRPFSRLDPPDLVAGLFRGEAEGPFHTAMAATVLPLPDEIREGRFLPSSRSVAYTKAAWRRVGGYPEWADYCEDVLFDMALLAVGLRLEIARAAIVRFPPRRSLGSFWRQYRNYARGDGASGLWLGRHAARYGTYLVIVPALAVAALRLGPWPLVGYLLGAAAYLRRPYARLLRLTRGWPWRQRARAAPWVPLIRAWGDLAKMAGFPRGLLAGRLLRRLNDSYKAGDMGRIDAPSLETPSHSGGLT